MERRLVLGLFVEERESNNDEDGDGSETEEYAALEDVQHLREKQTDEKRQEVLDEVDEAVSLRTHASGEDLRDDNPE